MEKHDLVIIGGSAAGTTAGIYAARRNLDVRVVAKDLGGEVATSGEVENWPGTMHTDGFALAKNFSDHLARYDVPVDEGVEVKSIKKINDCSFCIKTKNGGADECDYVAKAVIVATGAHPKKLRATGEDEFKNKGVSYCTVCDGPLFKGKTVAIIGGGNSSLEASLMMSDLSPKVYVITIDPRFTGDPMLVDKLKTKTNVEVIFNANTTEVFGDKFVKGLKYKDKDGTERKLEVDGIFVHIGLTPNSSFVPPEVEKDKFGQIKVNANCETNVPGFYAAGDVTDVPFKQIVIAAGQGTIALLSAAGYLNRLAQ
ncbi:MAG: hypothetical protein CEN90_287 [Parcubacteria group bacterium Licking1014_17]|nr:MAG: hypothetical protein CEN90_287 [Parcubacteria group bacterium Licking1014_17]